MEDCRLVRYGTYNECDADSGVCDHPEFAYTAEKWASLQDNRLEYGEIADLIHEYNTTVRQNELDYQKYKGKTSTDIAKEYYDSAAEVTERINYPEDDSANYANQLSSALNSEISADNLTEQGDSNVDDGEMQTPRI